MLPNARRSDWRVVLPLAHPLTDPYNFPVSPLVAAAAAAALVLILAFACPVGRPHAPARARAWETASWAGALSPLQLATRGVAAVLLLLVVAAVLSLRSGGSVRATAVEPARP